jgi:hypothetical protein
MGVQQSKLDLHWSKSFDSTLRLRWIPLPSCSIALLEDQMSVAFDWDISKAEFEYDLAILSYTEARHAWQRQPTARLFFFTDFNRWDSQWRWWGLHCLESKMNSSWGWTHHELIRCGTWPGPYVARPTFRRERRNASSAGIAGFSCVDRTGIILSLKLKLLGFHRTGIWTFLPPEEKGKGSFWPERSWTPVVSVNNWEFVPMIIGWRIWKIIAMAKEQHI